MLQPISDPYVWLEDANTASTITWLSQQQQLIEQELGAHPLRARLQGCIQTMLRSGVVVDTPHLANNRYFFHRRKAAGEQATIVMSDRAAGKEILLVDPLKHGADNYCTATLLAVSPDGNRVAVGIRHDGRDRYTRTLVLDLKARTTADISDIGPQARTTVTLQDCFYITRYPNSVELYRCLLDDPSSAVHVCTLPVMDVEGVFVQPLDNLRYVLILQQPTHDQGWSVWVLDQQSETLTALLVNFRHGASFYDKEDSLFMLTDWEAPSRRVLRTCLPVTGSPLWCEIVQQTDEPIQQLYVAGNALIAITVTAGVSMGLRVFDMLGRPLAAPLLPTGGTITELRTDRESGDVAFEFSSATCPPRIYTFRVGDSALRRWSQQRVTVDFAEVECRHVYYRSKDETIVPMTLSFRRDIRPCSNRPTLLTGYGGYGVSFNPRYSNRAAVWIAMGGLYAQASIRGGGEFGKLWHEAGRRAHKQNSFDDFIAGAEWLIREGYTKPDKLAIAGGSNGGLLMGAALTQRPELFAAVVCFGPILDMLRFHLFPGGALVGLDEYGSPDIPEEREWLLSYSPYHHVTPGVEYPAVLIISGDADTRCDPMHARKMVATLQACTRSRKPIVLDYRMKRGHAALLPVAERIETLTNQFCFLFDAMGITLASDGFMIPLESDSLELKQVHGETQAQPSVTR